MEWWYWCLVKLAEQEEEEEAAAATTACDMFAATTKLQSVRPDHTDKLERVRGNHTPSVLVFFEVVFVEAVHSVAAGRDKL